MKEAAAISYRKKGEKIIQMNYDAIDRGIEDVLCITIPPEWKHAAYEPLDSKFWSMWRIYKSQLLFNKAIPCPYPHSFLM